MVLLGANHCKCSVIGPLQLAATALVCGGESSVVCTKCLLNLVIFPPLISVCVCVDYKCHASTCN